MARPRKVGLTYAPWDCYTLLDKVIEDLVNARGVRGFVIYWQLCQEAYATTGYYLDWSSQTAISCAKHIGGHVSAKSVTDTVRYCLHIGLWDRELYERHSILTSHRMQTTYRDAMSRCAGGQIRKEYSLLCRDPPETGGGEAGESLPAAEVSATQTGVSATETPISAAETREIIIEKNTVKNTVHYNNSAGGPKWEDVKSIGQEMGWPEYRIKRFWRYYSQRGWKDTHGHPVNDIEDKMMYWEQQQALAEQGQQAARTQAADIPTPTDREKTDREKLEAMKRLYKSLTRANGGNAQEDATDVEIK